MKKKIATQQTDLFDTFDAAAMVPTRPLARLADPVTSRDAVPSSDSLHLLRQYFLDEVYASREPLTAYEIDQRAREKHGTCKDSVRKRASELVASGQVVVCEPRVCSVRSSEGSYRKCATYWVS